MTIKNTWWSVPGNNNLENNGEEVGWKSWCNWFERQMEVIQKLFKALKRNARRKDYFSVKLQARNFTKIELNDGRFPKEFS